MRKQDSENTYSHQKFAAEMPRDKRRRLTVKDDKTMKITLNATNDGARFSFMSIMLTRPSVTPTREREMYPNH